MTDNLPTLAVGNALLTAVHATFWHGFESPGMMLDYWHVSNGEPLATAVVRDVIAWTARRDVVPGLDGTPRERLAAYMGVAP